MPEYDDSVFLEVSGLIFSAWNEKLSGPDVINYVLARSSVSESDVLKILGYILNNMVE